MILKKNHKIPLDEFIDYCLYDKKKGYYMNKNPFVVNLNMPSAKALAIMNEKKITSLLVVSDNQLKKKNKTLKGIIHIHSLLQKGILWNSYEHCFLLYNSSP